MLTFEERVLCGNPLQWFGSALEPDPEPTQEFGPVANTSSQYLRCLLFNPVALPFAFPPAFSTPTTCL